MGFRGKSALKLPAPGRNRSIVNIALFLDTFSPCDCGYTRVAAPARLRGPDFAFPAIEAAAVRAAVARFRGEAEADNTIEI